MKKNVLLVLSFLVLFTACEDLVDTGDPRDKIVGSWKVDETHDQFKAKDVYDIDIEKHPSDSSKVLIINFFNLGNVEAEAVFNSSSLTLNSQILEDGSKVLSGSGVISNNNNQVNMQYKIDVGDGIEINATATYTKF